MSDIELKDGTLVPTEEIQQACAAADGITTEYNTLVGQLQALQPKVQELNEARWDAVAHAFDYADCKEADAAGFRFWHLSADQNGGQEGYQKITTKEWSRRSRLEQLKQEMEQLLMEGLQEEQEAMAAPGVN